VPIPWTGLTFQVNARVAGGEVRKTILESTVNIRATGGSLLVADDLGSCAAACSFRKPAQLATQ
jgi:hypothetical protein